MTDPVRHDPIRIVVVDDQVMVRDGLVAVLDTAPDITVVGQGGDGEDAVRLARDLKPDVVVIDIRMPRVDGLEATRRIVAARGDDALPRVLVLTTFDLDEYVYEALGAGASGFLLKDGAAADLMHGVRVVAGGDALLAPSVTRLLVDDVARRRSRTPVGVSALAGLTPREADVLRLIARGLSNAEIAGELFLAEQTVKTHVGRLLQKLGLRDRTQAVVFAYEHGIAGLGGGPA